VILRAPSGEITKYRNGCKAKAEFEGRGQEGEDVNEKETIAIDSQIARKYKTLFL
jgi:hypothetical protein